MSFDCKFMDAVVGAAQTAWSLQSASSALPGVASIAQYFPAALSSFQHGADVVPVPVLRPGYPTLFCQDAAQVFARPAELAISSALVQGMAMSDADGIAGDVACVLRTFGSDVLPSISGRVLDEKILTIHRFMKSGQQSVFTGDYVPLKVAMKNLARRCGDLGDCHNMALIFCMLASHAGIPAAYHTDLYHSFATAADDSRIATVDFAYGDERLIDYEYAASDDGIVHTGSGRISRRLNRAGIIALFLNRYGVELPHAGRLEAFLRAIDMDPEYAEAYANAGDVAFASGQYAEARGFYVRALARERWNIFFGLNLLITEVVLNPRIDRARLLAELDAIMKLYPPFKEGHYLRYVLTGDEESLAKGRDAVGLERSNSLLTYCREMRGKLLLAERLAMPGNRIFFFRPWEVPYGVFSNFAPYGFWLDGSHWRTVEHYFQANRFEAGSAEYDAIRDAATPEDTKRLARELRGRARRDFYALRDDIMLCAVREKIRANPELGGLLIGTGDAVLVENSPTDSYWGCGLDGSGQNRLGAILMRVREELRKQ